MSHDASRPAATVADDLPVGAEVVTPAGEEELAEVLTEATRTQKPVAIWGGGTHRSVGYRVDPEVVVSTAGLSGIVDWQPEDLTVVVRAGTPVAELEAELKKGGQSAILPEVPGAATVGGVIATGSSAYARLRYGPTRDRVLEVRAVTGDGRPVKGGGRVVKNVSGFDLPRLFTGSLGSLGVITTVCLKLWPEPHAARTVHLAEASLADSLYRPRAVLQTRAGVRVFLSGTASEVEDQVSRLGAEVTDGLDYPDLPPGDVTWSVRVRPKLVVEAISRLPDSSEYIAQHGVGEVTFVAPASFDIGPIREWAEDTGGAVVRIGGHSDHDPWGTPPTGLEIQRRLIEAFDPARVLEPGRLPGGL